MIPIHELLSRIRWDREFGRSAFEIGYYDRIRAEIVRVPFTALIFPPDSRHLLLIMTADGIIHSLPLHRIREVYRDNELLWRRPPSTGPASPRKSMRMSAK
jgi:uncharacterized protein (UPF0248 family)